MRPRFRAPVEVLDPDLADPRLRSVKEPVTVWSRGSLLTFAARRQGPAPTLIGTVREPLRPAGDGVWALRLRVPRLQRACIEYQLTSAAGEVLDDGGVWRGAEAGPEAPTVPVSVASAVAISSPEAEIAQRHPARLWSPEKPCALMLCADGEGLETWASAIAAAALPVALVGIISAGLQYSPDRERYDANQDPRACAYLSDVDLSYFAAHLRYAIDSVLPWARAQVGDLPVFVFGVSNGAAFAAAVAAHHPNTVSASLAFSLGLAPHRATSGTPRPHALVAGQLEPGFHQVTTRYAEHLRRRGAAVRLKRPVRGHDHTMWRDELVPALRWVLAHQSQ